MSRANANVLCCNIYGKGSGEVESALEFSRLPFYAPSISVLEVQHTSYQIIPLYETILIINLNTTRKEAAAINQQSFTLSHNRLHFQDTARREPTTAGVMMGAAALSKGKR